MTAPWDVAVIGAGPAGAIAARSLAAFGLRVALIDKAAFPRFKVCGCCLNADALAALKAAGLGSDVAALGGEPVGRMTVAGEGRRASLRLARGLAVSRSALDGALVAAAVERGVCLYERTTALGAEPTDAGYRVALQANRARTALTARAVLAAEGLGGGLLRALPGFRTRIAAGARIGVATVLPGTMSDYPPGTIHMACGRAGYCGVVRVEQGQLAVAAAMEPAFVRDCGGAGAAASRLLVEAGFSPPDMDGARWKGTPQLSRQISPKARPGLYLAGDAAGYVEPFTGEGMAWALASGSRFAAWAGPALAAGGYPDPHAWQRRQQRLVAKRQRRCARITRGLRRPLLVRMAIGGAARWPAMGGVLVRSMAGCHPPSLYTE